MKIKLNMEIKLKNVLVPIGFIAPWLIYLTMIYYPHQPPIIFFLSIVGMILTLPSMGIAAIAYNFEDWTAWETLSIALLNAFIYFTVIYFISKGKNKRKKHIIILPILLLLGLITGAIALIITFASGIV
jgi:hypothetical protein